jgi:hypothetical protein
VTSRREPSAAFHFAKFYLAEGFSITHYANGDVHFALELKVVARPA